jgi:NAD(P)-dependent dehydrogenase (short-subunit alcohol dehydrogenase family)
VVFVDLDEPGARGAAEASKKLATNPDYKTKGVLLDVTRSSDVAAVFKSIVEEFGRIDYLVNSAGVIRRSGHLVCVEPANLRPRSTLPTTLFSPTMTWRILTGYSQSTPEAPFSAPAR